LTTNNIHREIVMSEHRNPDDNTTGHEWDGIKELNNPPPRWWTVGFYAGLAFVAGYYVLYPSSPLNPAIGDFVNKLVGAEVMVHGHTKGIMHLINPNEYYQGTTWTQREIDDLQQRGFTRLVMKAGDPKFQDGWTYVNEARDAIAEIEAVRQPYMERLKTMSVREILDDPNMKQFALGRARVLFGDNCAACHGAGGAGVVNGAYSFPNLTDDDWLYGGWPEKLVETITQGREGMMPAKGGNDALTESDVDALARFVVALSKGEARLNDAGELTAGGAPYADANKLFQETCFACHGRNARGAMQNGDFYTGAANLTDVIWRFGGSLETVKDTITNGRQAKMPTFGEKLDELSIKILAVKVHQLGGGMTNEPSVRTTGNEAADGAKRG
jgi:cytochrome c oxidase cbb3-type subunit 3